MFCVRVLIFEEINGVYEYNIGLVIIEIFNNRKFDWKVISVMLVKEYGLFVWLFKLFKDVVDLVLILEEVVKMVVKILIISNNSVFEV